MPGRQTPPKTTFSHTQVHCLPHRAPSCPVGAQENFPANSTLSLQPQRTKNPPLIPVQVCEALAHPGTSWHICIPLPGRPPSTSQTSGGRAALQAGTSQARIILVSRYLGISSALYLLKRLFRSRLACLRGLTAATDTMEGHRRDCHPTLSPKTHTPLKPCRLSQGYTWIRQLSI